MKTQKRKHNITHQIHCLPNTVEDDIVLNKHEEDGCKNNLNLSKLKRTVFKFTTTYIVN